MSFGIGFYGNIMLCIGRFRLNGVLRRSIRSSSTVVGTKALKHRKENTITESSDFAFRKDKVNELAYNLQDDIFYPLLKNKEDEFRGALKMRVPTYRNKFELLDRDELHKLKDDIVLGGKICSIRKSGKGSMFIDIVQDFKKVQLMLNYKNMGLEKSFFAELHENLRPGDQILCFGKPSKTMVGELSLKLTKSVQLMSPALHPLPPKFNDTGKLNKNRVIGYLVNGHDVILLRVKIIKLIRDFLEKRDFLSVETPILCSGNSGANAMPFETRSQHMKNDDDVLSLRVAPELWLKKLIISGFDKVYEIGKCFRNEGIDATHNCEFTSCEFYQTFTTLEELMQLSEDMFKYILNGVTEDQKLIKFHENCSKIMATIDANGGKFKRVDFIAEISKNTGVELSHSMLNKQGLLNYYEKIGLPINTGKASTLQLVNGLSEEFVENRHIDTNLPVFIYNIPEIVSPLAKSDSNGVSRRFEMYIEGKEYINAYEEENNPFKQERKFTEQHNNKVLDGELESIIPDYKFVESMEWGMPPTGGWGMGIDRLVMKISGCKRIEEVLPFGCVNDVIKQ